MNAGDVPDDGLVPDNGLAPDDELAADADGEPFDGMLDAILASANCEMLDHVRARIHPEIAQEVDSRAVLQAPSGPAAGDAADSARPKTVVDDLWALSGEEELCLALELTVELTDAIDLSLDMALAVSGGDGCARVRALLHALCVDLAAARDFEPEQARASTLAFACDAPLTPDRVDSARSVGRSRMLDFAIVIARTLERTLSDTDTDTDTDTDATGVMSGHAHAIVRRLERARDLQLGQAILRRIDGVTHVDTSGADLSYLRRDTLEVPAGTTWSEETKWPTGVGARLRTASRKYRSGRYLVEVRET
ncbi:hypothetical protein ABH935_000483 [Catenulispora sp. GAS73]|uniref:hypothetical protein n=1 Tax=Catenulispora sp. GAS73 TaxID=3156269 RepID=UPI0035186AAC